MNNIKIAVCCNKPCQTPKGDLFFPVQSGKDAAGFSLPMQGDNTGDNISARNEMYGEFTAWYWVWKNIKTVFPDIEYIGLAHYRRFFAATAIPYFEPVIKAPEIPKGIEDDNWFFINALKEYDIILPKKVYFPGSVKDQYCYCHDKDEVLFSIVKRIVHQMYPDYDESFSKALEQGNSGSFLGISFFRWNLFNDYYAWLFPILFEAEREIIASGKPYQKRVLAFIAERLCVLYMYHNNFNVMYLPVYFIGSTSSIRNTALNPDGYAMAGKKAKESIIARLYKLIKPVIRWWLPYGYETARIERLVIARHRKSLSELKQKVLSSNE